MFSASQLFSWLAPVSSSSTVPKSGLLRARRILAFAALAAALLLAVASFAQDGKVIINDRWPIRGPKGPNLSPPHFEPTCLSGDNLPLPWYHRLRAAARPAFPLDATR